MTWRLYFVTDEDWEGIEDCFIVARSEAEAELAHVESEGVDPELAFAHYLCDVSPDLEARAIEEHRAWSRENAPYQADKPDLHPWPSWADDWLLTALGAEIRVEAGEKVVLFAGEEYYPHTLEEVMASRARATTTH